MPTFSNNVFTTSSGWMNKCKRIKKRYFILLVFCMGCILSCIPYKNIDFQIMRPAQIRLGTGIEKVYINCAYCQDSALLRNVKSDEVNEPQVSLNFLFTLKEKLYNSPLFTNSQFILISPDSLLSHLKDYNQRKNQNELVIMLDSIYLLDTVLHQKNKFFENYYYAIIHKFGCRTYTKSNMQLIDNYLLEDTVFWPPQPTLTDLYLNTPEEKDAFWDTGISAGEKYARYLAPYWTEQSRIFYLEGKKPFKKAFEQIQKNQLDSSLLILKSASELSKSNSFQAKTLYNMAIIYELKDDLEKAYQLADSSNKIMENKVTEEYAEKLRLRKIDKIALDWQLN